MDTKETDSDIFIGEISIENIINHSLGNSDAESVVINNLGDVFIQQLSVTNVYGSSYSTATFTKAEDFQAHFMALWPRNKDTFVGRETLFESLTEKYSKEKNAVSAKSQRTRFAGLGGIGKTHTAVELSYQLLENNIIDLPIIISGKNKNILRSSIIELANLLGITVKDENNTVVIAQIVYKKLSCLGKVFIIFDDVDSPQTLQGYYPSENYNISALITSRDTASWGPNYDDIPLKTFEESDSIIYAEKTLTRANKKERFNEDDARALGKEVGHFQLALAQAMAFIVTKNCTIQYYVEQYQKHKKIMLSKSPFADDKHQESVWLTITLCLKELKQKNAILYLMSCAFLAAEKPILIRMFKHFLDEEDIVIDESFEEVAHYGLITYTNQTRCVRIHDIVQQVLMVLLGKAKPIALKNTIIMLGKEHLSDTHEGLNFSMSQANLPHAQQMLEHVREVLPEELEKYNPQITLLQSIILLGLTLIGNEKDAEPLSKNLMDKSEMMIEEDPFFAATIFMQLFGIHLQLRQFQKAFTFIDNAITLSENHSNLRNHCISLKAYQYTRMGKAFEALNCLKKIPEEQIEAWSSPTNESEATSALICGCSFLGVGQYTKAEKLLRETLIFFESGPNTNSWLLSGIRTTRLLLYQRTLPGEEAIEKAKKELRLIEEQKGEDHHDLTTALRVLADLHLRLGKKSSAIRYCKRAIKIIALHFGDNHWEKAIYYATIASAHLQISQNTGKAIKYCDIALKNLGDPKDRELIYFIILNTLIPALTQQGNIPEAKDHINNCLNEFQQQLRAHPIYHAQIRGRLGKIFIHEKKFTKAKKCLLEVLAAYDEEFGTKSEWSIPTLRNLCWIAHAEQNPKFGKPFAERAIAILEEFSPVERPQLAEFYAISAGLDQYLGRIDESLVVLQRAVKTLEQFYPKDNQQLLTLKQSIALVFVAQGKPLDALRIIPTCVTLLEKKPDDNSLNLAHGHRIWAEALANTQNFSGATNHLNRAQYYLKQLPERNFREEIHLKKILACIYFNSYPDVQKIKQSKVLSLKALAIFLEHFGIGDPEAPKLLNSVANACFNNSQANGEEGDLYYACATSELSIRLAKKFSAHPFAMAFLKIIYAGAVGKLGDYAQTIVIAKSAIEDFTKIGQENSVSVGQLYSLISTSQIELGQAEDALFNRRKAVNILERLIPPTNISIVKEKEMLKMQETRQGSYKRNPPKKAVEKFPVTAGFLRTVATSPHPITTTQCLRVATYCLDVNQPSAALLFIHYAMINDADKNYSLFLLSKCHMAMKDWVDLQYTFAQLQGWTNATHKEDIENYRKSFHMIMARRRLNLLLKNALLIRVAEPPFHTCDIQFLARTCIMLGDYQEAQTELDKLTDNLDDETFYLRALLAFQQGDYNKTNNELNACDDDFEEANILREKLQKTLESQQFIAPLLGKLRFKIPDDLIIHLTEEEDESSEDTLSID